MSFKPNLKIRNLVYESKNKFKNGDDIFNFLAKNNKGLEKEIIWEIFLQDPKAYKTISAKILDAFPLEKHKDTAIQNTNSSKSKVINDNRKLKVLRKFKNYNTYDDGRDYECEIKSISLKYVGKFKQ